MNNIKSSLFIWFITTLFFILGYTIGNSVISLTSFGLVGILYLLEGKKYKYIIYIIFIALIFFENKFAFYIPLFLYSLLDENIYSNILKTILAMAIIFYMTQGENRIFIALILLFSIIIKLKDMESNNLIEKYRDLIIDSKERQIGLQSENERLIESQDKSIKLAISNERNRIARDIHDGVGHIISRTILQIGAMLIVEKDEIKKDGLNNIKFSLDESMYELRRSLHNLQENNINLKNELEKTISKYSFSNIIFNYYVEEDKDLNFKYSIIYIVNECLNNIIKHSNANLVEINLRETDDNIFILIKDNGTSSKEFKYGIGLNSIATRVKTINGKLQISNENGFRVFINIEKEEI